MFIRKLEDVKAYVTKDKSIIQELFHPIYDESGVIPKDVKISVALATIKPGRKTVQHYHKTSHEIYYVISGKMRMHLHKETREVEKHAIIYIPPRTSHWVENIGLEDLLILCIGYPPYLHEDTVLEE